MIRRCQYCGRDNNIFLLQFRLLLFGKVYYSCKCGKKSSYVMISHIVHDTTDKVEKEYNKDIEWNKKGGWRNG